MQQAIRLEEWEVVERLGELQLNRSDLLEIVKAAVVGYSGCTDFDPPTARGYATWQMGVRRAREVLCPQGWIADDTGGLSTVVNDELGIRIAVINTDDATGRAGSIPQNRSRKGAMCESAVTSNQLCFPEADQWPLVSSNGVVRDLSGFVTWHLCLYIAGRDRLVVRAELSAFTEVTSGYFSAFRERLLVVGDGDWDQVGVEPDIDDLGPEFEIEVRRK